MLLAAGLDVGGSSVKAWVADVETGLAVASATSPLTTHRPAADRAEVDLDELEAACRSALAEVVDGVAGEWAGLTVCTLRQGFVLVGADGVALGRAVLNSDRRGAPWADLLEGTHDVTGHWPAPELTLPKLVCVSVEEPDRWAATSRVLFLHDWLLWRLAGVQVTEASYACAGGMADVPARAWAVDLLERTGVGTSRLAPLVEAGTVVGELVDGWALPASLPVVAGCGDTQVAALGVGGLGDGVVTVVAGSSTPVQVAVGEPVRDPLGRPWVSTHARRDLWAAEGNAGYPGSLSGWWSGLVPTARAVREPSTVVAVTAAPYWSRETWQHRPPASLVGVGPGTGGDDVAAALVQAHAFAVRGSVEDLQRALGRDVTAVVVTGGAAADGVLPALLAEVLGRDVHHDGGEPSAAVGGAHLVARAVGAHTHVPSLPATVVPAGDPTRWVAAYERWREVAAALQEGLR